MSGLSMGRPARTFGTRKRTQADRTAEAVLYLARARSTEHVTAQWLAERFALPLAKCASMLAAARGR